MNDFDLRILEKLQLVRLVALDVDGVLTDGSIILGAEDEMKRFDVRDGAGLALLQQMGVAVAVITRRKSRCVERRCEELGIARLHQGVKNKIEVLHEVVTDPKLAPTQVLYMGDDLVDLGCLHWAGVSAAPADANAEVLARVDIVTKARGGHGAVREVAEMILKAQNKWQEVVRQALGELEDPAPARKRAAKKG